MFRRKLPLTLAVVGVLIILTAVIAAAMARSSDTATLTLGERLDVPVVVTEPGVLDAVASEVTVRATADDDQPVLLAIGRSSEVEAWLGDSDHARVTGLSSWEELTVEVVTAVESDGATEAPTSAATDVPDAAADGAEDEAALPNPAGSDLWVVQTVSTGSAELSWSDSPGRWSLVAATDGTAPAPTIELEWGRQVPTPWLVPAIIAGALALVAGLTMFVLDIRARREERRREDARARGETGETDAASITDTGERLTRRQVRETTLAARDLSDGQAGAPPVPVAPVPVGDVDDAAAVHATSPDEIDVAGEDAVDNSPPSKHERGGSSAESASWRRSVGGFGRGAGGRAAPRDEPARDPAKPEQTDQHDDREER